MLRFDTSSCILLWLLGAALSNASESAASHTSAVERRASRSDTIRSVLMSLYRATDGTNWSDKSGWDSSSSYCEWTRISCAADLVEVTRLELYTNSLDGTIPINDLVQLARLRKLEVSRNSLRGTLYSELAVLTALRTLDFGVWHDPRLVGSAH